MKKSEQLSAVKKLAYLLIVIIMAFAFNANLVANLTSYIYAKADGGLFSVDDEAPKISVGTVDTVKKTDEEVIISATVTDNVALAARKAVMLFVRVSNQLAYTEIEMIKDDAVSNKYIGTVKVWAFDGQSKKSKQLFTDKLYYYVTAVDSAGNKASSTERFADVEQYWGETTDYSAIPYLLITEFSVASGNDQYEFVELYNNSSTNIDLSGFEFRYMTEPNKSLSKYNVLNPKDGNGGDRTAVLKPGAVYTIWIQNTNNGYSAPLNHMPASELESYYYGNKGWNDGTVDFVDTGKDANLGYIYFASFPNSGAHRGFGIYTNTGELITEAYLNTNNGTNTDVTADKGIFFRYPTDGGKGCGKVSANTYYANPGKVVEYQVPKVKADLGNDLNAPVIEYSHNNNFVNAVETDGLDFEIWAMVEDDTIVNSVYIYYRMVVGNIKPERFIGQSFIRDGLTSWYCAYIDFGAFIRQDKMEFYIEAKDIAGNKTLNGSAAAPYVVDIMGFEESLSREDLSSNIKEYGHYGGEVKFEGMGYEVSANDLKLEIDNVDVGGVNSSERYAYFIYEVIETDYWFKNGVTVGENILHTFEVSGRWYTYTVRIPMDMLLENDFTISLHAGNTHTPFYDLEKYNKGYQLLLKAKTEEEFAEAESYLIYGDGTKNAEVRQILPGFNMNRDDYRVRDVRLVLADGTTLYDVNTQNSGMFADGMQDEIYTIGDSGNMSRFYDFKFDIPKSQINTKSVSIDTTKLSDGAHSFKITNTATGKNRILEFYVDNTAPTFEFNFKQGALMKGLFSIDPIITELGSQISARYGYLDGMRVGIPYTITSGDVDPGIHNIEVTVIDGAGNKTVKSITFRTEEEKPDRPQLVGDDGRIVDETKAQLTIKVSDPSNDKLKVEFFEAYRFSADNLNTFTGYYNAVDIEPPSWINTTGETQMSDTEYDKIKKVDGQYLSTESHLLPYQRFEINVGKTVKKNDIINVKWYGKSFEGRRVTLYGWDLFKESWEVLDFKIAGESDFTLQKDVLVETYVNQGNGKMNILVQDEVAGQDEKFTFAWLADTQYYMQRNAFDDEDHTIADMQVDWLINNKEALNIKYTFHSGDIINATNQLYQWDIASDIYKKLENARIPYGVLAGNHDVKFTEADYAIYSKYFGEARYKDKSWYGESYMDNRGHYDTINVNGRDFMMVYMGWIIGANEINWMNKVIRENPDKTVFLNFHEYLNSNGIRTGTGDTIYNNVVLPNKNVKYVTSGHIHGGASRVDFIDDDGDGISDRKVTQMLGDYQSLPNSESKYDGGDGFLRLMEFDPAQNTMTVKTISPWRLYLNELGNKKDGDYGYLEPYQAIANNSVNEGLSNNPNYNEIKSSYNDKLNSFTMSFDTPVTSKLVATDAIFVNYYSANKIGEVKDVASGSDVTIEWNNLKKGTNYFWYAKISDENGGVYISDSYKITTAGIKDNLDEAPKNSGEVALIILVSAGSLLIVAGGAVAAVFIVKKRKINKGGN